MWIAAVVFTLAVAASIWARGREQSKLRGYCALHGHAWERDFTDELVCLRCGEGAHFQPWRSHLGE